MLYIKLAHKETKRSQQFKLNLTIVEGAQAETIAFYDFDGTVTRKDTMFEFLRFYAGNTPFLVGMVMVSPMMAAFKTGLVDRQKAKEFLLSYFLKDHAVQDIRKTGERFSAWMEDQLVRPDAMDSIRKHQANGTEVVIVTASADIWVQPWCDRHQLKLVASRMEVKDGRLTGKLNGLNCHGNEKVNRIRSMFDLSAYQDIYCYGDTKGDLPLLSIASKPHYRVFKQ